MQQLTIIKIGGRIIDEEQRLSSFLRNFSDAPGRKILVHGGGSIATDIGRRMGILPEYVDGRRVTDEKTLALVIMVYGGLVNKRLVAHLQAEGCNAAGLTGADGNAIRAVRRVAGSVDYGHVGDVQRQGVNTGFLKDLLDRGITPVLAPLTHDGHGGMLNTNADTIAQETAKAFACIMNVQLVYCFEKKGVLSDPEDEDSVIEQIRKEDFERLRQSGTVNGGMIPKLENAFSAIEAGVRRVIIGQAEALNQMLSGKSGTQIL